MSSSDLFVFDGSPVYHHSSTSEIASTGADLQFYSDCLNPFPDSPIDILLAISDDSNQQNPSDQNAPSLPSSSPPSHQLQNLSLTRFQALADSSNPPDGFPNFSSFEVKTEGNHLGLESAIYPSFFYDENAVKMMQRSFSSKSFDGKPGFLIQSQFDALSEEPPNLQPQEGNNNNLSNGQMRRVCSTGDLQVIGSSFMEEATNFKVGRYSAEERKERIHRYRAKRNQRNFNKTIKYACRKTLADNRPRIRGRFARNDETAETPNKPACSNRYEDEDEIWMDGLHEEEDGTVRGGTFFNSFGQTQFQYYATMAIDN